MRHAGAGSRRYHILGRFRALGATLLHLLLAASTFAGPVELKPSSDSRLVYVSAAGSDANPGTIDAPLQSISAGMTRLRSGFPDWLCLHAGDVWPDGFPEWRLSGRSQTEPVVITRYGPGARPLVLGTFYKPSTIPVWHLAIAGLAFTDPLYDGSTSQLPVEFIRFLGLGGDLLVQDCAFANGTNAIVVQSTAPEPLIPGVRLINNRADDFYTRDYWNGGAFCYMQQATDYLIEGNVVNRAGQRTAAEGSTARGHGFYLQSNCGPGVIRGNTLTDIGCIAIHCRSGAVIEDNLIQRASIGIYVAFHPSIVRRNIIVQGTDASPTQPLSIGLQIFQCESVLAEHNTIIDAQGSAVNRVAIEVARYTGPGATVVPYYRVTLRDNTIKDWAPWLRVTAPDVELTLGHNNLMDLCPADVDQNGVLNVNDFVAYVSEFANCP